MNGKFVGLNGQNVTVTPDAGGPNVTHAVANGATVTRNNKTATVADFRAGDHVVFTGDPATTVAATGA